MRFLDQQTLKGSLISLQHIPEEKRKYILKSIKKKRCYFSTSRALSLGLFHSLILQLSLHVLLLWQVFPTCSDGELLLMCSRAQKRLFCHWQLLGCVRISPLPCLAAEDMTSSYRAKTQKRFLHQDMSK